MEPPSILLPFYIHGNVCGILFALFASCYHSHKWEHCTVQTYAARVANLLSTLTSLAMTEAQGHCKWLHISSSALAEHWHSFSWEMLVLLSCAKPGTNTLSSRLGTYDCSHPPSNVTGDRILQPDPLWSSWPLTWFTNVRLVAQPPSCIHFIVYVWGFPSSCIFCPFLAFYMYLFL